MNRSILTLAVALTAALATACGGNQSAADNVPGYSPVRDNIPASTPRFQLGSADLTEGGTFAPAAMAAEFGCHGTDHAPRLTWSGAPAATKSYTVTMFDPDAPTGSGFWHWLLWDIPAATTRLDSAPPAPAVVGTGDGGKTGYMGPCPPPGDPAHHYRITVLALDTASLGLPATTAAPAVTFTARSHVIGYAQLTATASQ